MCVCVGTYQFVVFFLCGICDTNLECAETTDQALQAQAQAQAEGESFKMDTVDEANYSMGQAVSQSAGDLQNA